MIQIALCIDVLLKESSFFNFSHFVSGKNCNYKYSSNKKSYIDKCKIPSSSINGLKGKAVIIIFLNLG